jgi:hypothetical protein
MAPVWRGVVVLIAVFAISVGTKSMAAGVVHNVGGATDQQRIQQGKELLAAAKAADSDQAAFANATAAAALVCPIAPQDPVCAEANTIINTQQASQQEYIRPNVVKVANILADMQQ